MPPRLGSVVAAIVLCILGATVDRSAAPAESPQDIASQPAADGKDELRRLYDEDQADRNPILPPNQLIPRDRSRLRRVKELFAAEGLRSAKDYYHSAMILQHGEAPEDFLLAHEFGVVAMATGGIDPKTRWLAAASEDRFLMSIGRPQRFGTQLHSEGAGPVRLYTVSDDVTDGFRRLMAVPPLAEAKAREAEINKQLHKE